MIIRKNQAAIITGGASGLGLACVKRLTSLGMKVYVLDLPSDEAVERVKDTSSLAHFLPVDVTDEVQVERALQQVSEKAHLRVVINSAGVSFRSRIITELGTFPIAEFRNVVDVNLVGTFNVSRLAARVMSMHDPDDEERGIIINVSSIAAFEGQISQAAYAASKAAVAGLTLPLARDLAEHKIRVVGIAPGLFETPFFHQLPNETIRSVTNQIPYPSRLGTVEEFSSLVEHVISNPMINGENIRLDGALRLGPR